METIRAKAQSIYVSIVGSHGRCHVPLPATVVLIKVQEGAGGLADVPEYDAIVLAPAG